MSKITIITDSACDIGFEFLKKHGIRFLPATISIAGKEYRDKIDILPKEFYKLLEDTKEFPRTSLVSPAMFEDIFNEEVSLGNKVLCITVSSGLSGTNNSAKLAKSMAETGEIRVVDSLSVTGGLGLLVYVAANLIEEGKDLDYIVTTLEELIERQDSIMYLDTLEMLRRGGRIPSTLGKIGQLLNIKPVLSISDGKLEAINKARGIKSAYIKTLEYIKERNIDDSYPIIIPHGANLEMAIKLDKDIKELYPNALTIITDLGPVVGCHGGKSAVAAFFINKK